MAGGYGLLVGTLAPTLGDDAWSIRGVRQAEPGWALAWARWVEPPWHSGKMSATARMHSSFWPAHWAGHRHRGWSDGSGCDLATDSHWCDWRARPPSRLALSCSTAGCIFPRSWARNGRRLLPWASAWECSTAGWLPAWRLPATAEWPSDRRTAGFFWELASASPRAWCFPTTSIRAAKTTSRWARRACWDWRWGRAWASWRWRLTSRATGFLRCAWPAR